ncbi:hypothetical protein [Pseudoalteromonas ardens]|uniref:hypothetical protein n=1 Tax=Pseudoalteromonas ardens TaxID=3048490 RepID=UPI000B0A129C|nr:hypothetical protein [Pseudoalteromonas sp. R96]MDK1313198.1 hypothetical protein [Pseudoalteromonas sp. R96]
MKFFIKRLKKDSNTIQLDSTLSLSDANAQLVSGGNSGGTGAQPRVQRFSPGAEKLVGG